MMASSSRATRPVSTAVPAYAYHQSQEQMHRARSGSGSMQVPSGTGSAAAASTSSSASPRPRQISSELATTQPPFQAVHMDQVMASASQNTQRALTELLQNYNNLLQEREQDRQERTRMNTGNSKLWNLCSNLKRERESLQKELNSNAASREIRHLASRVLELESLLQHNGLSVPANSNRDGQRLSPGDGPVNSPLEQEPRRPSPGARSASDNGATRERQRSLQSDRERMGMMSSSNSTTSFSTAYSEPGQIRERERERRRAGAGTPPTTQNGNMHMSSSLSSNLSATGGSPQISAPPRPRDGFSPATSSGSMPPLSSSASTSVLSSYNSSAPSEPYSSSSNMPIFQPRDKGGLATIPSTPIINDGEGDEGPFAHPSDPNYTSSPVSGHFPSNHSASSRAGRSDRSDPASSEHLRIAKHSPVPSSPALSVSSLNRSQGTSQHSPRSPNLPHSPVLFSSQQDAPSPRHAPNPPIANTNRVISRKASSLDLARPDKPIPQIPPRSATPPPDLGNPKQPASPTQYATLPPKTPPRGGSLDEIGLGSTPARAGTMTGEKSIYGTPMVELPDEARRYIMAANGGLSLPSPVSPFNPIAKGSDPPQNLVHRPGGLGISSGPEDGGLAPEPTYRPRRASSALQAVAAHASQQLQQPSRSGRISPLERGAQQYGRDVPFNSRSAQALQGSFQDESTEQDQPSSPVQSSRPHPPERASSDRTEKGDRSDRPRAYTTGQPPQPNQHQHPAMPGYHASAPPPLQQPPSRNPSSQQSRDDYGNPQAGAAPSYGLQQSQPGSQAAKCVPLVPGLLSAVVVDVVNSNIKIADRGRELVVFHVRVAVKTNFAPDDPRHNLVPHGVPRTWIVEKSWTDVQVLDNAVKAKNAKGNMRKLPGLPDKSLFKDHAPSKVDQRKRDLQKYLHGLCEASALQERSDICMFLTGNIVSDRSAPVSNPGYKAGYLTKKGRNFGGWATRYYVLQGRLLEYYDTPGGQHLGSIDIKDANIGRQNSKQTTGGDDSIRHAFLIRAKDKAGEETDHILCAESDEERDHWVNMLVCCLTGEYIPDTVAAIPVPVPTPAPAPPPLSKSDSINSTNSKPPSHSQSERFKHPARKGSEDLVITRGSAQPISQLQQAPNNQKLFGGPSYSEANRNPPEIREQHHRREQSAGQSSVASGAEDGGLPSQRNAYRRGPNGSEMPPSASLPANLDQLSNSESQSSFPSASTSQSRLANTVNASDADVNAARQLPSQRPKSPEKKIKISAPSNGVPIGADFKRKEDRRNKVKSSFWGFADRRAHDRRDANAAPPRPVFGVPIQEAVEIARVREDSDLPAVVFRCVQYLSSVKAESEEGIYRLSGSSAVIKALKDRFNCEGDVDLTAEYYDPHAVAGLLKTFFRELPVHLFTQELNPDFIRANDIEDRNRKIKEITRLVSLLPVANYSALRFLSAHLVNIVKAEQINKMNVRNMGIVFSPTLAIPATLFSLFINEFDRIFREVDAEEAEDEEAVQSGSEATHIPDNRPRQRTHSSGARRRSRNSTLFTQSGADRLLESHSDLEAAEEEEAPESMSDTEHGRGYVANNYDDETVKHHRRHKLTVDVNSDNDGPSQYADYSSQKSPSIASTHSPRHLHASNNPLRSPGLPGSPRHVGSGRA